MRVTTADLALRAPEWWRAVARARSSGRALLDLSGDTPHGSAPFPLASSSSPEAAARRAIAAHLAARGAAISPEHIVLTASRAEALSLLFATLAGAHGEVLVSSPSQPALSTLAELARLHLAPQPLAWRGDRFAHDVGALYEAVTERTRAILLASPHDVTGASLDPEAAESLRALDVPLIVDESLAFAALDAPPSATVLGHASDALAFVLGDLSLVHPDARLAWIAIDGPGRLARRMLERLESLAATFDSITPLVLAAAPALLATSGDDVLHARARRNLAALRARAEPSRLFVPHVDGGVRVPVRLPADRTDEQWAIGLLEASEPGALAHPGLVYDLDGTWLVLGLLTPPEVFDAGVDALLALAARIG